MAGSKKEKEKVKTVVWIKPNGREFEVGDTPGNAAVCLGHGFTKQSDAKPVAEKKGS